MIRSEPVPTVACPSCLTEFPVDPAKVPEGGIHAICSSCQRVFRVDASELETAGASLEVEPEVEVEAVEDEEPDTGSAPQPYTPIEPEPAEPGGDVRPPSGDSPDFEVVEEDETDTVEELDAEPVEGTDVGTERPEEDGEAATASPDSTSAPSLPEEDRPFEDLRSLASEAIAEPEDEDAGFQVEDSTLMRGRERFGTRDPHERARRLARVLVSDIIAYYPVRYHESFARGTLKEDFEEEVKKSWKEYVDQVGEELAESTPYFDEALNEILGKGESVF